MNESVIPALPKTLRPLKNQEFILVTCSDCGAIFIYKRFASDLQVFRSVIAIKAEPMYCVSKDEETDTNHLSKYREKD